jgi:hypothetical protein
LRSVGIGAEWSKGGQRTNRPMDSKGVPGAVERKVPRVREIRRAGHRQCLWMNRIDPAICREIQSYPQVIPQLWNPGGLQRFGIARGNRRA